MIEASEFEDLRKLHQIWTRAVRSGGVAKYEDVVVGNVGRFAQDLSLFRWREPDFDLINCGKTFAQSVGWPDETYDLSALPVNLQRALKMGIRASAIDMQPHYEVVRCIRAGSLGACEFLFLPLQWRRENLSLAFCRHRERTDNLLDAIYSATSDGMLVLSPTTLDGIADYEIVSLNNSAAEILQTSQFEACWSPLSKHFDRRETSQLYKELSRIREYQRAPLFEFSRLMKDGSETHLRASVVYTGELLAVTLSDITEMKEREHSVRQLFEHNPIPHFVYEPGTLRILQVNEAAIAQYGYSRDEFINSTLLMLHPEEEVNQVREASLHAAGAVSLENQWTHLTASKRLLNVKSYSRELVVSGQSCVLASVIDVTEQRRAEDKIVYVAHHDHLTGLANRALFSARLEQGIHDLHRYKGKLAVLCLDLDDFKQVNDTLGHPIGDALLQALSQRLQANIRDVDLVARIGGDEFSIIQFFIDNPDDAATLAHRLIQQISEPIQIEGHELQLGLSIGIAISPDDSQDPHELLKQADIALYRAKLDGKGTFRFFESAMDMQLKERHALEIDLRMAIQENQFELHYQPLVDVETETIVGCEALIRWKHPTKGNIPPSDFIPVAEETGLIGPIGDWVLREACAEAATWPNDIKVAVNLSPVQFRNKKLLPSILNAIVQSGLPAFRLEIEITESVLFADSETNLEILEHLRAAGIGISMDDFGTGYSSLNYLRSFPFDKIKIDRSFVSDLLHSADCVAIVKAVALLGSNLSITTLAEGVETVEQFERLKSEGYQQIQGYLFSRPLPAIQIRELIRSGLPYFQKNRQLPKLLAS